MSDTPRTDRHQNQGDPPVNEEEFRKILERELNAKREELVRLETDVTNLLDSIRAACILVPAWLDESPFKDPCDEFGKKHPDLEP